MLAVFSRKDGGGEGGGGGAGTVGFKCTERMSLAFILQHTRTFLIVDTFVRLKTTLLLKKSIKKLRKILQNYSKMLTI